MAIKSEHVQSTAEHDSSPDRAPVEKPQAFDEPSFDLASEFILKATPPEIDAHAAALRRLQGETRERLMTQFQQSFGNRHIQRVMDRVRSADQPADDFAQRIQAASSGGSALDASTRERLQANLGVDLSGVRVHLDDEADRLSESVEATAFTTGNDIFFRKGRYQPETPGGLRLIAHEAAHTLQQASGPVAGTPWDGGVSISDPVDDFERAAEQAAEQVVSGRQAAPLAAAAGAAASTSVQRCGAAPSGCSAEERLEHATSEMPLQRWSEAGLGSPLSIQRQDDDEEWYGDESGVVTFPADTIVGDPGAVTFPADTIVGNPGTVAASSGAATDQAATAAPSGAATDQAATAAPSGAATDQVATAAPPNPWRGSLLPPELHYMPRSPWDLSVSPGGLDVGYGRFHASGVALPTGSWNASAYYNSPLLPFPNDAMNDVNAGYRGLGQMGPTFTGLSTLSSLGPSPTMPFGAGLTVSSTPDDPFKLMAGIQGDF